MTPPALAGRDAYSRRAAHTGPVITCEATKGWRYFVVATQTVTLVGGLIMLGLALAVHDSASVPVAIIGGAWTLIWAGSYWQTRRTAYCVTFRDSILSFSGRRMDRQIRCADVSEYRRTRSSAASFRPAVFLTKTGERIKVAGRMTGLFELLVAIRQDNESFVAVEM